MSAQKKAIKVPHCIGIIMDGNRRFASERGLPILEGHRKGKDKLIEVARWAREAGVNTLIVYAFSTENWKRSPQEVNYLMDLLLNFLDEMLEKAEKDNIRIRFLGQIDRFNDAIQKNIARVEKETELNTDSNLGICLSYGGRAEILHAIKRLPCEKKEKLTEEEFSKYLWTFDLPDPDIIIRTSGEERLSGFLSWQSVYSELFFINTHWPAFTKEEFLRILDEFAARERRKGK